MVDLDPAKLLAKGLTPLDVANAVNAQNLTLPSGTAKIGDTQYMVRTNAVPATIDDLNNIPVKFANGATVLVKDLGYVRDGSLVQQNVVRADGRRSVLLSVIKNGSASVDSVLREGAIAAGLTALMILLFLGSWRSTLVVMISIPLSVLSSLI